MTPWLKVTALLRSEVGACERDEAAATPGGAKLQLAGTGAAFTAAAGIGLSSKRLREDVEDGVCGVRFNSFHTTDDCSACLLLRCVFSACTVGQGVTGWALGGGGGATATYGRSGIYSSSSTASAQLIGAGCVSALSLL